MKELRPDELRLCVADAFLNRWMLLTAGDYASGEYNTMTVAWGFLGAMWKRPVAIAVVRPTRYTYTLINVHETFTLCAFPKEYRSDLTYLGTHSGREGDKIAHTSLTPVAASSVPAPVFEEAELAIECRKIYTNEIVPENMIDASIEADYPDRDYHRVYYGEIVAVHGSDDYR